MDLTLGFVSLCLVLLHSSSEPCPLDSKVEKDVGCDVCRCCRFATGEYQVICKGKFERVPHIPTGTTDLQMFYDDESNTRVLKRETFPFLPELTRLEIGHTIIVSATSDSFRNLPRLRSLDVMIELDTVTSFLNSAPKLRELTLQCIGPMTREKLKTLFHGLELETLRTFYCNLSLDQSFPLDIRPGKVSVLHGSPRSPGISHIDLPGSAVVIDSGFSDIQCLNFTEVKAASLSIFCQCDDITIEPGLLDWMDMTDARVSIVLHSLGEIRNFDLGGHRFYSLRFDQQNDFSDTFIHQLLKSIETAVIRRLSLSVDSRDEPYPAVLPADFLNRLIGSQLWELALTDYPIGRADGVHFNLEKFYCTNCHFRCYESDGCTFSERLRVLHVSGSNSRLGIDFVKFVIEHPGLEELVLMPQRFKVVDSFTLPYHDKLRHLHIQASQQYMFFFDLGTRINISGLVNLETFTIRNTGLDTAFVVSKNVIFSGLKKLHSFDFSYNKFSVFKGSIRNLFIGLDALRELKLAGHSKFYWVWGNMERLVEMLHPVTDTLEILDLSQNQIDYLPAGMFTSMKNLRRLDLHKNSIASLDTCEFSNNIGLSKISLNGNKLEVLKQESVMCLAEMAYLRELNLDKNRFMCTCETRKLRDWMKRNTETINITYEEICPKTGESAGVPFQDFRLAWIDCDFHKEALALSGSVMALVLMVTVGYTTYYFRYDIIFWWAVKRRHRVNRRHSIYPTKRFHAFLSYASSEQLIAEDIFFKLEEGDDVQFKIAYDCRDFLPIYTIADNIIRCIKASEKVIFLITKQFIEREWTTFELDFAHIHSYDEKRNLIILIFVEKFKNSELPQRLRVLCRNVNYLQYPDHADRRAVQNFWHRLRLALSEDSELETGGNQGFGGGGSTQDAESASSRSEVVAGPDEDAEMGDERRHLI